MIDHISLRVSDYERALAFYKAALAPLGYEVLMAFGEHKAAGLGARGKADFWVTGSDQPINPTHVAFMTDREAVHAFHAAALAAGGQDFGAPGLRAEYHPHYYGAFVLDPDGNNIEACCHWPDGKKPEKPAAAAAKKPAAKARKPAAKKPVAKKPVAKKPVAKKPVAKKPVAKKPVAKKPVAKKPVAKKPVAKTAGAKKRRP